MTCPHLAHGLSFECAGGQETMNIIQPFPQMLNDCVRLTLLYYHLVVTMRPHEDSRQNFGLHFRNKPDEPGDWRQNLVYLFCPDRGTAEGHCCESTSCFSHPIVRIPRRCLPPCLASLPVEHTAAYAASTFDLKQCQLCTTWVLSRVNDSLYRRVPRPTLSSIPFGHVITSSTHSLHKSSLGGLI